MAKKTMVVFDPSKRSLFRHVLGKRGVVHRPPWAVPEYDFVEICTGCKACVEVCEQSILKIDNRGQPYVDFERGECTFCHDCVQACPSKALMENDTASPWTLKASVSEGCLAEKNVHCQSCGDVCEREAIKFTLILGQIPKPEIDSDACSGCGACISICPAKAIKINSVNDHLSINKEKATKI